MESVSSKGVYVRTVKGRLIQAVLCLAIACLIAIFSSDSLLDFGVNLKKETLTLPREPPIMPANEDRRPDLHQDEPMCLGKVTDSLFKPNEKKKSPKLRRLFKLIKTKGLEQCIIQPFNESWTSPGILHTYQSLRENPEMLERTGRNSCFSMADAEKLDRLGEAVQEQLSQLQNPGNCNKAKRLVFGIDRQKHGLTGIMHFVAHALMFAYGTQRTLVLKPTNMAYGEGAWEEYILPLSNTCLNASGRAEVTSGEYSLKHERALVVEILIPRINRMPGFSPPLIPRHILAEFRGVDCDPAAWWTGQMMRYIFRLREGLKRKIHRKMLTANFGGPIVGVHVRRRDKVAGKRGASRHEVGEYMAEVDRYFDNLNSRQPVVALKRKIYLATDDVRVIDEVMEKYPKYAILSDRGNAMSGGGRRTVSSLAGIVIDLYLLTQTNFLVCTFSSGVCRAAYELMISVQARTCPDVRSLDCNFYFYKRLQLPMVANSDHDSSSTTHEIAFRKGDLIYSYGILGEGYSAGVNLNESVGLLGVYPSSKASPVYVPVDIAPSHETNPGRNQLKRSETKDTSEGVLQNG